MSVNIRSISFCTPVIEEEEVAEVVDTLRSGWLTTGKKVLRFEELFCERLGVSHAIAVNSATSAWQLVLSALEIGIGDEVIIPAISWPSMANMIELAGAKPVFADVCPTSLQLEASEVRRLITARTKAVIPVHFAGAPFDVDAIKATLSGKNIHLIEDAAHAIGTRYKGSEVGSWGSVTLFSFHPIKNITTGEGGMIVCEDEALAEKLRLLRFHGISKDAWKRYAKGGSPEYEVVLPGYKCNMMDIQAALGLAQFPKIERFNAQRRALAARYNELLGGNEWVQPLVNQGYEHVHAWHLYVVKLNSEKLSIDRNAFIAELGEAGIGAGIHFPATHQMQFYREKYAVQPTDLPHATQAGKSIFSLPLHPGMTNDDVAYIVESINAIARNNSIKRR